jgi:hypothetical protein
MFGMTTEETIAVIFSTITSIYIFVKTFKNIGFEIIKKFGVGEDEGTLKEKIVEELVKELKPTLEDEFKRRIEKEKIYDIIKAKELELKAKLYTDNPEIQEELLLMVKELRK